ncbi:MAG TPA: hypothetical protein VHB01_03850 [Nitrosospira sp.]|jgi:hypothetical protein|nr:hypothetical protein [Nitrosospira sp.]
MDAYVITLKILAPLGLGKKGLCEVLFLALSFFPLGTENVLIAGFLFATTERQPDEG